MEKRIGKSIYTESIEALNISELLMESLVEQYDLKWRFVTNRNWVETIQEKLEHLDFTRHNYVKKLGFHWGDVLTSAPFNCLTELFSEEDILNVIKNDHLKVLSTDKGVFLNFYNHPDSALYDFFEEQKEDDFKMNISYSINVLLVKIRMFLVYEFANNICEYGVWHSNVNETLA